MKLRYFLTVMLIPALLCCQEPDSIDPEGDVPGGEVVEPNPDQGQTPDPEPEPTPEPELAPEIKDGSKILVTNEYVEKFLTDVKYPTHDYTYSSLLDWAEENGIHVSPCRSENTDKPQVYTIRWDADEDAGDVTVKLWEDTWSREQTLEAGSYYIEVTNLCPNTHYHYEVTAGDKLLTHGEFDTEGRVHQLFFKSRIRNCRDLGGWKTEDGKTVKYRMLYRGGRLNGSYLSKSGKEDLKAEGIRAQLDLRGEDDVLSESTLASFIEDYAFCAPCIEEGYSQLINNDKEKVRQCMEFIMDCVENNKPVFFHCSLGRDRTGTITMLLLGFLGVPEGDISQEYELTQFAPHGYATSDGEKTKMTRLADYDGAARAIWAYVDEESGETFADGVEKYFLEIGLSQEDLDKFRSNMLK